MSYFGVSLRNGVGLGLGTVPSLTNTPLSYRLAPSLDLSFAGSDTLSPAITFSRTTNATLTNSAGLVANAPMNLLTFSEQFDNAAWTKGNATIAANSVVAPNGTTTADTVTGDGTSAQHYVLQGAGTTGIRTISVYAKAGTHNFFQILTAGSANPVANFDLVNGTANMVGSGATASITSENNGWYRCVLSSPDATATNVYFALVTSLASGRFEANTISGSVYFWGAQLEIGSTSTTYNPTTVKNLLGFTENFDNAAWTKSNASISATKVDDIYGQPFAQKLVASADTSQHAIFTPYTTTAAPYTFSIYAKAAEQSWLFMRLIDSGGTARLAWFNIATGVVGTVGTNLTAAITSTGNGFYRCAITVSTANAGAQNVLFGVSNADGVNSYTGDGTSGIYIFGAQLSDSASVDPYVYQPVAAPSSVAYYGPRFDYDPVTLAPKGLLIEEQRTNLARYSEDFSNAVWTNSTPDLATVALNAAAAPNGALTANLLTATTGGTSSQRRQVNASSATGSFTGSVFLKAGSSARSRILLTDQTVSFVTIGNFQVAWDDGVASVYSTTGGTASVVPVGNGWYRCIITASTATANATVGLSVFPDTLSGTNSIYAWGAQLEAGSFATSYIPTVASQVTRAADNASMIGNNFARWYNVTNGTFYINAATVSTGNRGLFFALNSANTIDRIFVYGTGTALVFAGNTNGVNQFTLSQVPGSLSNASALAYQVNDFAATSNGAAATTDNSGSVPPGINQIQLGYLTNSGDQNINGTIKRFAFYSRRLSNTELQGITS